MNCFTRIFVALAAVFMAAGTHAAPGDLDTSFSGDGIQTTAVGPGRDEAYSVIQQADGKLVVAGYSSNGSNDDFALVRYNSDGSLDATFSGDGKLTTAIGAGNDQSSSIIQQADGKLVMAGSSSNGSNNDIALVRYNSNGSLDTTFSSDGKLTTAVGSDDDFGASVIQQADGKLVVAGTITSGVTDNFGLVRYNSNGSLDTSFSGDGKLTTLVGTSYCRGYSLIQQADGKLVVVGEGSNGTNIDFALARYNSDGSLDTTFSGDGKLTTAIGTGTDRAYSVIQQPDGKLVVAGYSSNGSNDDFALVRYNSDGSLDTTFGVGGKQVTPVQQGNDEAFSVIQQSDGRLVVAGTSFSGSNFDFALVRYNSDGSLDTTFSGDGKQITAIAIGSDALAIDIGRSIIQQSDGKLVVAGYSAFGDYDFSLVRYHTAPSDAVAPTVPAGLSATAVSANQINLSWTASTDAVGVTAYKIYRGGSLIATPGNVTSYSDTGLTALTLYSYTVAACDAAGNCSAQSSAAAATTLAPPDTTAPTVPSSLSATAVSATQINLSWTASTDAVGVTAYKIYRGGSLIATLGNVTSYSNTGLTASTLYSYTVAACDAAGNCSAQSAAKSATTLSDTIAPTVPAGLSATAVSANQINLSWSASTDAVGVTAYKIYRGGSLIATLGSVTSYSDTGLTALTPYSYKVAACDAAGNCSAQSAAKSATTLALDSDGDGITDPFDNCPFISNPTQTNTDGDAQGDACDADNDNDGMSDTWEATYGLNPFDNDANSDIDGDGRRAIFEYLSGTDPLDATSYKTLGITTTNLTGELKLLLADTTVITLNANGFSVPAGLAQIPAGIKVRIFSHPVGLFCQMVNPLDAGNFDRVIELEIRCSARKVNMQKLGVYGEAPSVVKVITRVTDVTTGVPIFGLQPGDFYGLDDGVALGAESFLDSDPIEDIPTVLKTVFLLDVSSSLSPVDVANARSALISMLVDSNGRSKLLPGQQIAIYTFDDTLRLVQDFTSVIDRSVIDSVNAIQRGGSSTNLYGAIETGLGYWNVSFGLDQIENGNLIVITDGEDTAGISTLNNVVNARTPSNKVIYALAVGANADVASLTAITGDASRVKTLASFTELSSGFYEISKKMIADLNVFKNGVYAVYYASPKRTGTHTVTVGINDNACLTNCTVTGSYNANGFTNVSPMLIIKGLTTVESGSQVIWSAKTRFSNDNIIYQWSFFTNPSNEFNKTVDVTDDRRLFITSQAILDDAVATIRLNRFIDVGGVLYPDPSLPTVDRAITATDGVSSSLDNCPTIPNANQLDTNGDGVGDVCSNDDTAPTVPSSLFATAVGANQINLSWAASTDAFGVTSYKIYRGGTLLTTLGKVTGFNDTGLVASTLYSYTVSACDAVGNCSAQSSAASATTLAATDTTAPTVPAGLAAVAASNSQINLSWNASTDAVGVTAYKIYRGGILLTTLGNVTSYSNTGLSPSTMYSYAVAACDAASNCSAQSSTTSATTMGLGSDGDSDGIADSLDNCPLIANANQLDWDSDGIGDACDDPVPLPDDVDGVLKADKAGSSVAFAGDFNGDGYGDYVIGMPGYDSPADTVLKIKAKKDIGRAEVISGKDGSVLASIEGSAAKDAMGFAVAGGADIDGDGFDDVVVGAPNAGGTHTGTVTVIYGRADGDNRTAVTLNGTASKSQFGTAVALGNVDGVAGAEVLVGAPKEASASGLKQAGSVSIYAGTNLSRFNTVFYGATANAHAGTSVATGKLNNDGIAIVIGAPNENIGSVKNSGSVKAYLLANPATPIFTQGGTKGSQFGKAVAVGDVNNDSYDDVLVGAPLDDDLASNKKDTGSVTVFSVISNTQLTKKYGTNAKAQLGYSVAAGDVNGDKKADIIAGAWKDNKPTTNPKKPIKMAGSVAVFSGNGYAQIGTTKYGNVAKDYFGSAVGAGDINSDGKADIIIGIPGFDLPVTANGKTKWLKDVGKATVVSGDSF